MNNVVYVFNVKKVLYFFQRWHQYSSTLKFWITTPPPSILKMPTCISLYVIMQHRIHFQHPDYGLYNDIAILEVDGEVSIDGTFVDTIALAPADAEDFVGADCEIVGWGQTESKYYYASFTSNNFYINLLPTVRSDWLQTVGSNGCRTQFFCSLIGQSGANYLVWMNHYSIYILWHWDTLIHTSSYMYHFTTTNGQ